jgi:hypothetical protein
VSANKPRKFKLHFNRVNMQRGNPNIWTVHQSGICYQVQDVVCMARVQSVYRPDRPQPRAYFTGIGVVVVAGSTAYIYRS